MVELKPDACFGKWRLRVWKWHSKVREWGRSMAREKEMECCPREVACQNRFLAFFSIFLFLKEILGGNFGGFPGLPSKLYCFGTKKNHCFIMNKVWAKAMVR